MATTKPKAAVIGEALEPVLSVLDGTFARATNDEVIEVVLRAHEELARRAKNVSKLARDVGDRDIVNEAHVYCSFAYDLVPTASWNNKTERQNLPWHDLLDAKARVDAVISRRAKAVEPLRTRGDKPRETEASLDVAAFTDDQIVEAVAKTIKVNRYGRGTAPASSYDVLTAIAPKHNVIYPTNHQGNTMASPSVLRMAQRLAKLAKAGRIVRYERKWGGPKAWGIAGATFADTWLAKQYVVSDG